MKSREVKVAGLTIGGGTPIKIQTMCNTHTQDVIPSVEQCVEMDAAGAELIRLTTQGMKEVEALKEIKKILRERGIETHWLQMYISVRMLPLKLQKWPTK